jgi:flagellar hook assembly protein FlgD
MSFSYQLSEPAAEVLIVLSDASGEFAHEIAVQNLGTHPQATPWDGRDKFGNLLPTGSYDYRFEVVDHLGNASTQPGGRFGLIVDTAAPGVVLRVDSTYLLSDPRDLEIEYRIDEAARVEIEIFDDSWTMVNYLKQGDRSAGVHGASWDGTDFAGNPVPVFEKYSINLRATDPAGNATEERARVVVEP